MGWWWSSSPRADEQLDTGSLPSLAQSTPSSSISQDSSSKPSSTTTTDDAELREFLAAIDWTGETSPPKSKPTSSPSSSDPNPNPNNTPSTSTSNSTSDNTPQPSSISFESLYPDHMSCRSAFDYAFFCQSFGGQWVNVYRYGELRSCSEHWENFWLCMKARGYSDESRKQTIRDHYRKKAVKYKTGPSSEDVWEVRTEPVRNPFGRDISEYEDRRSKDGIKGEPLAQG